ncbi:MAG: glycosyltransferase family 2 protein [Rhodanobacteraceae bacterium]
MFISLLITTYNWKEALRLVLGGVAGQSRLPDEVVVADDGSRSDTAAMLREEARDFPVPLRHVWQEDRGFRAARSRNLGIAAARGDYIVLIDGDMLLHRHFIADHETFARPGFFLQGGRLRATEAETARLFAGGTPRFSPWLHGEFDSRHDFKRHNAFRWSWLARIRARPGSGRIMSCNMSFWRDDLLRVNGFDEQMLGYGSEDLEVAVRLKNCGIDSRQLRFAALAIHLHHATRAPPDPDDLSIPNNRVLRASRIEHRTRCELGVAQHLAEFATQPPDLRDDRSSGSSTLMDVRAAH